MAFLNRFAQGVADAVGGEYQQPGVGGVAKGTPTRDGSGVSERIKLKDYQIIELKRCKYYVHIHRLLQCSFYPSPSIFAHLVMLHLVCRMSLFSCRYSFLNKHVRPFDFGFHTVLGETRKQLGAIQSEYNTDVEELSQQVRKLQSELNDAKATQRKEAAMHKINIRESEEENESLRKQLHNIQQSIMVNEEVEQQFDELVDEIIADATHTSSVRETGEESISGNHDSASIMSAGEDSTTSLTLDHAVGGLPSTPKSAKKQILSSFSGHDSIASLASHGTTQSRMGDARVVARVKRQLSRALQRMEMLTNQMAAVKQSCDKIIGSIRQECEVQLDQQTRNEVELLNQLSELEDKFEADRTRMDAELQHKEDEMVNLRESADFYQEALRELEGTIQHLQSQLVAYGGGTMADDTANGDKAGAAARSAARDMLKLEESLEAVKRENELLKKNHNAEMNKKDQQIKWLEEENYGKDQSIQSLTATATSPKDDDGSITGTHGTSGRGRGASFGDTKDMRSQMKNLRMISGATGLDGDSGRTGCRKPVDENTTESAADDIVKNMHQSWSPEGHLGRRGSAEVLMKQQQKLERVTGE